MNTINRLKELAEKYSTPVMCVKCHTTHFLMSGKVMVAGNDFVCEFCRNKEREERRANKVTDRWANICPSAYLKTNLAQIRKNSRELAEIAERGVNLDRGLGLIGRSGAGKTRAMWFALAKRYFEGVGVLGIDSNEFSRGIASKYAENPADAVRWIESMIKVDAFFIDDIGKGKMTERVESELFGIVDGRTKNLKPIYFTSNMTKDQIAKVVSNDKASPLFRRLVEFCDLIEV